jgi:hypothetical protein
MAAMQLQHVEAGTIGELGRPNVFRLNLLDCCSVERDGVCASLRLAIALGAYSAHGGEPCAASSCLRGRLPSHGAVVAPRRPACEICAPGKAPVL